MLDFLVIATRSGKRGIIEIYHVVMVGSARVTVPTVCIQLTVL